MRYIQYFYIKKGKLSPDDKNKAILIIDGRYRISRCHEEASENNGIKRPRYDAYQILEGETLNNAKPITDIFKL